MSAAGPASPAAENAPFELSRRQTGMAFRRTRLSADRTLLAAIRTSLSLNSFGFTIAQIFQKLKKSAVMDSAYEPRVFGMALVWLGIGIAAIAVLLG
jgi:putative membrane protein